MSMYRFIVNGIDKIAEREQGNIVDSFEGFVFKKKFTIVNSDRTERKMSQAIRYAKQKKKHFIPTKSNENKSNKKMKLLLLYLYKKSLIHLHTPLFS
jgi:hypothetical protein